AVAKLVTDDRRLQTWRLPPCFSRSPLQQTVLIMPIRLKCTCGKVLSVRDELAGKAVKCPGCQTVLRIPAATAGSPNAGRPQTGGPAAAKPAGPAAAPQRAAPRRAPAAKT